MASLAHNVRYCSRLQFFPRRLNIAEAQANPLLVAEAGRSEVGTADDELVANLVSYMEPISEQSRMDASAPKTWNNSSVAQAAPPVECATPGEFADAGWFTLAARQEHLKVIAKHRFPDAILGALAPLLGPLVAYCRDL